MKPQDHLSVKLILSVDVGCTPTLTDNIIKLE